MDKIFENRIERLREGMLEGGFDSILISNPFNRYYFANFKSTAGYLLVTKDRQIIATDFRYKEIAKNSSPTWEVVTQSPRFEWVKSCLKGSGVKTVAVEADTLSVSVFREVESLEGFTVVETSGILHKIRAVKDGSEIDTLREAVHLGDLAFEKVLSQIKEGQSELLLGKMYEMASLELGADGISFSPIVAGGENAAKPHHHPTQREVKKGECIVFDCGVMYKGYCSDLTRTFVLGNSDAKIKEVHEVVFEAQKRASLEITAGMTGEDGDKIARDYIVGAGYGDNFGHGLGHGVGLEIHELPRVAPKSKDVLGEGMVFTIEPGVYLSGWGGVRIEDVFVMQKGKPHLLSHAPYRELSVV